MELWPKRTNRHEVLVEGPEVVITPVATLLNPSSAGTTTTGDDAEVAPAVSGERSDAEQQRELITAYQDGATLAQLSQRFSLDRKTISRFLHRSGVPVRRQNLTPDQVALALELNQQGWSPPRIATELGASTTTIRRRLRDHHTWPHPPLGSSAGR